MKKKQLDKNSIFILCATDEESLPLLCVMLLSLADTADRTRYYEIVILKAGALSGDELILKVTAPFSNLSVSFLDVSDIFSHKTLYTKNRSDLSRAAYYRLAAPGLFPDRTKVLYLDCDLIIRHDIGELFDLDIGNAMLGAVRDYTGIGIYHAGEDDRISYYQELHMDNIDDYFNSGVLLMNLACLRDKGMAEQLLYMAEHEEYRFHDQDILNIACLGQVKLLGAAWNVAVSYAYDWYLPDSLSAELAQGKKDPYIIHFSGHSFKPYVRIDGPSEQYFWPYATKAPEVFRNILLEKVHKAAPDRLFLLRCTPRQHLAFELDVVSHCNLNCQSCTHFSPVAREEFIDLSKIKQDFQRLSLLFDGTVEFIHLMGGEPLLHPEIAEIAELTRQYFPHGRIEIVTNGMLLITQPSSFWKTCRDNNIQISVTKYPIDLPFEEMRALAFLSGVKLVFYNNTAEEGVHFRKLTLDPTHAQDPRLSFPNCYLANECITLHEGKLYPCTLAGCAYRLNETFPGTLTLSKENGIDIYKVQTGGEILRRLCQPIPFCAYCESTKWHQNEFPWTLSKGELSEWI